ncbi:hypothetical protein, partial [Escherichia coli]|uniref:hypothetical protein n=1 Tax=Escherichia coli TaxID=562 RepID=UPI00191C44ED
LKVPLAALRFRPANGRPAGHPEDGAAKEQAVWIQGPSGTLRPVQVVTGAISADQVALKDGGLADGDRVVVGQAETVEPPRFLGIRLGL